MIEMAAGSVLKPFHPQSMVLKQTDVLIQALLHFGLVQPTGSSTPLITQFAHDQLDLALSKLTISDQDHPAIDPKLKKLIRSHVYDIHSSHHRATISVRSWTMSEHIYRQQPCPFPTLARGLFTRENVHPDREVGSGRHCIVARGYDKFFNINELPSTKWDALKNRTKPPYHLTLKTNGCIILIAALSPTDLLVTSKHATVSSDQIDQEESPTHSAVGDRWVDRHLEKVGMSRSELAHELWVANATAVAELTDDDFEEHVIPTPINEIGLNLHGVNLNTAELLTYPPDVVAQCAKRWGMHPTPFTTVNDIQSVMKHCENIEKQGWEGRQGHVEGVVVRGTPRDASTTIDSDLPAASIFWKVKFEEPYLTYREWRELTRKMIKEMESNQETFTKTCKSHHHHHNPLTLKDSEEIGKQLKVNVKKIHKPETRLYVHWVIEELIERPNTFQLWKKNRGIVATRLAFLEWRKSKQAISLAEQLGSSKLISATAPESTNTENEHFDKTLLVPIGIPGCGKTTLAVALKALIDCAHTQSDDIKTKKTGPAFIENVKNLLLEENGAKIVIADKNNHLKTHRETLVEMISKLRQGIQVKTRQQQKNLRETKLVQVKVRLIAITWDLEEYPAAELHHLASQRIVQRGDNHQSLRPELTVGGVEAHDTILWRFLKTLEEFDPDMNREDQEFHHIIQLKFADSLEENLKKIFSKLKSIVPKLVEGVELTEEKLKKSLLIAQTYKPTIKKEMKIDSTLQNPRYFGIKLQANLTKIIEEIFSSLSSNQLIKSDQDDEKIKLLLEQGRNFFLKLCKENRITSVPHITLLHKNEFTQEEEEEEETKEISEEEKEKLEKLEKLWIKYQNLVLNQNKKNNTNKFKIKLGPKLIWNHQVMVIQANVLSLNSTSNSNHDQHQHQQHQNEEQKPNQKELEINNKEKVVPKNSEEEEEEERMYHVTIGTLDESIRPIQGLHLLNLFFNNSSNLSKNDIIIDDDDDDSKIYSIDVECVVVDGVLKGLT